MVENDKSQYAAQGSQGANVAVDVMDVLLRGLDTARRNIESQEEGAEGAGLFCGFAYGSPGTFCPLFYWHAETAAETAEETAADSAAESA